MKVPTDHIDLPLLRERGVTLHLRREDLIHPRVSGNKYRKLKYNLEEAIRLGLPLLTFGGAFSNHIAAAAYAGHQAGLKTIGVIRGEELADQDRNATLRFAEEQGMQLHFVDRNTYRKKSEPAFLEELKSRFGAFYLLPEGGTNELAVKGCAEILTEADKDYTHICCAVGTGGTIAGLVRSAGASQQLIGFPAVRDKSLQKTICNFAGNGPWRLVTDYDEGGYAKMSEGLVHFINDFKMNTGILLDPIYTAKMMRGILDLVDQGNIIPGSNVLAIHTGGLQAIAGMNARLEKKNLPTIAL